MKLRKNSYLDDRYDREKFWKNGNPEKPEDMKDKAKQYEERTNQILAKIAQIKNEAEKHQLELEASQLKREFEDWKGDLDKAAKLSDKLDDGRGGFFGKNARENKIDRLQKMPKGIDKKLADLEVKLGINSANAMPDNPDAVAIINKYTTPYQKADGKFYVKEIATGKEISADDMVKLEAKNIDNRTTSVGGKGGLVGMAKDGLVNGLGYKESNANNITKLGTYAVIAAALYYRWNNTKGIGEKAAWAFGAYALLSPCGFDLWNIAMNGKSSALNGKGLRANAIGGKTTETAQNTVKQNQDIYENLYKNFRNDNFAIGAPLYAMFKNQSDLDAYILDQNTGDVDWAKLLNDYKNPDSGLKEKLNTKLPGDDASFVTPETYMRTLEGLLVKNGAILEGAALDEVTKSLNNKRSEYLKSIGLVSNDKDITTVASKLSEKEKLLQDMKDRADFAILEGYGYIVKDKDGAKVVIDAMTKKGSKSSEIIDELKKLGLIELDKKEIDKETKKLNGAKAIKNLDQLSYKDSVGAEAIVLVKKEIQKEEGIDNLDIYNDNGELYIQTDKSRTKLVIDGGILRLGDPFNSSVLRGNLKRMIYIGLAVCHAKEYLGLLNTQPQKDKDGKEILSTKEYFAARSRGGLVIDDKWFDSGIMGTWTNNPDPINNATKFLNPEHAHTSLQEDRALAGALNALYKNRWTIGKATQPEHLPAYIKVDDANTNPLVENSDNAGKDIKIKVDEESLREQLKGIFTEIGGIGTDAIGGLYDGVTLGLTTIQKDFIKWARDPEKGLKAWYELGVDALDTMRLDVKEGIKKLAEAGLNSIEYVAKRALTNIFHGLGYTYEEMVELLQKNKLLAIVLGALAGYGIAGLLGAGVITGTALGASIGGMIAYATATMSKAVTHPRS